MGQKDYAQNDYFKDKVRFADICNGIIYHGKDIVKPEELQELDTDIVYYDEKEQLHKIIPDKIRMWKGICISIISLESQTKVDYSMVLRTMKEEMLFYYKQWIDQEREARRKGILKKGEKYEWSQVGKAAKLVPIVVIVIYFGTDKIWDGAKCLYDMLNIDKDMEPYITNYKMNLFDYHEHEDFSFFKTENRLFFETLACADSKRKIKKIFEEKRNEYKNLDENTLMLLCDLMGLKNKQIVKEKIKEDKELCKAIEELENDARKEGIEEGIKEGKTEGFIIAINNLMESLKISEVQAMDLLKLPETEKGKYMTLLKMNN